MKARQHPGSVIIGYVFLGLVYASIIGGGIAMHLYLDSLTPSVRETVARRQMDTMTFMYVIVLGLLFQVGCLVWAAKKAFRERQPVLSIEWVRLVAGATFLSVALVGVFRVLI